MSITFPRDLPLDGCITEDSPFELKYQQSSSLTGGSSPNVASIGPDYWEAKYQTEPLSRADFEIWHAWLKSLRGGLKLFKGRQARRKWPLAYPQGFAGLTVSGSPWDGTGNLSVIGASRDTMTVNQVPNGFVLKTGDYVSIPVGSRQHLHKIIEDATASGAGSVVLTVEPAIRPNATTAVEVRFEAAYCDMVITSQSVVANASGRGGSIAFEAQQVLI